MRFHTLSGPSAIETSAVPARHRANCSLSRSDHKGHTYAPVPRNVATAPTVRAHGGGPGVETQRRADSLRTSRQGEVCGRRPRLVSAAAASSRSALRLVGESAATTAVRCESHGRGRARVRRAGGCGARRDRIDRRRLRCLRAASAPVFERAARCPRRSSASLGPRPRRHPAKSTRPFGEAPSWESVARRGFEPMRRTG